MKIYITTSIGKGPTRLAAFDDALLKAGVANYNLIRLSSIIPPGSEIISVEGPIKNPPGSWGDRLYVVMADQRIETPNVEAWAGIGWVQDTKTGRGLLVEHENYSETAVTGDIEQSLGALKRGRNVHWDSLKKRVVGEACHGEPVCALAVAVFQADDWQNNHLPTA
ncbi:pyruvoyl-dependent arginine decarboxylase [Candidatus Microgenomates bacterium]|nr:pyruvoyl-dependent arginine decarboxylase [Candidatus Microgenomates bacterium]